MKNKNILNNEKAHFSHVYFYKLLFEKKPKLPNIEVIRKHLKKFYNDVDIISKEDNIYNIAINDLKVKYEDDKEIPAQLLMPESIEFDYTSIDDKVYSQMFDIRNPKGIIENCSYEIMISDFLSAGLDYKDRASLLNNWLMVALKLFEDCIAVYNEQSGKLLLRYQILHNTYPNNLRFLFSGVNIRIFSVENSDDIIVDTLGMYAIGLPDIQYHFKNLDIKDIVSHALNTIAYIFDNGAVIKSGDTLRGFSDDVFWNCRYENSLLKPYREILDINTLEYAAGNRKN